MQGQVGHGAAAEHRIGEWIFAPAANELRRGEERRRIEHRAARTLELLCRRRGAVVSREEILAEVWNGRAISPNSVPVVIKDIRQALGDDAREPRHVETVAKLGYRLLPDQAAEAEPSAEHRSSTPRRRYGRRIATAALLALLVALAILTSLLPRGEGAVPLIVGRVDNATGSPRYRTLATAAEELILQSTGRMESVRVLRGAAEGESDAVTLKARLILWNGRPDVMMAAEDQDGVVIWTGMTDGGQGSMPSQIAAAMEKLERTMMARRAAKR